MHQPYVRDDRLLSTLRSRIIRAAQAVHKEPGPGFQEVVYQRLLALDLAAHDVDFSREVWIDR